MRTGNFRGGGTCLRWDFVIHISDSDPRVAEKKGAVAMVESSPA